MAIVQCTRQSRTNMRLAECKNALHTITFCYIEPSSGIDLVEVCQVVEFYLKTIKIINLPLDRGSMSCNASLVL